MLEIFVKILIYFAVGFVEMFMATQRTYWISKGKSSSAALLVFFENFISFFVIYRISTGLTDDWGLLVFYAIGNSLGTYINLEKVPF